MEHARWLLPPKAARLSARVATQLTPLMTAIAAAVVATTTSAVTAVTTGASSGPTEERKREVEKHIFDHLPRSSEMRGDRRVIDRIPIREKKPVEWPQTDSSGAGGKVGSEQGEKGKEV